MALPLSATKTITTKILNDRILPPFSALRGEIQWVTAINKAASARHKVRPAPQTLCLHYFFYTTKFTTF